MVSLDMISGSMIIIARGVARNYHLGRLNFNFPILWQEKFKFWGHQRAMIDEEKKLSTISLSKTPKHERSTWSHHCKL